jgi:hypothetical protein
MNPLNKTVGTVRNLVYVVHVDIYFGLINY